MDDAQAGRARLARIEGVMIVGMRSGVTPMDRIEVVVRIVVERIVREWTSKGQEREQDRAPHSSHALSYPGGTIRFPSPAAGESEVSEGSSMSSKKKAESSARPASPDLRYTLTACWRTVRSLRWMSIAVSLW